MIILLNVIRIKKEYDERKMDRFRLELVYI